MVARGRWQCLIFRFVLLLALTCVSGVPVQSAVMAQGVGDSYTVRYFDQLRKRRLFSVAEQLGTERLVDPLLTPGEYIQITVELSKTYAEHARHTSGEEQELYWQFAETVVDEALAKYGSHPRSLLLEVQKAFVPAARGKFLGQQRELFPYDSKLKIQTDKVFETAVERLKAMESKLARQHRQRTLSGPNRSKGLATFEIHDRHSETRFRLAMTLQEFAKTKPPYSPVRTTLLKEAYPWLEVLSERRTSDPFVIPATIRLAENHRMRGNLAGANTILTELESEDTPQKFQSDLLVERVHWLMDNEQLAEAQKRLEKHLLGTKNPDGELVYLQAFVLVQQWEIAERTSKNVIAENLLEQIQHRLKSIPATIGRYWTYRISRLGDQLAKAKKYGSDVAKKVELAESLYAARQWDQSITAYGQAMALADQLGKPEIAFDLGYTAASIAIQQQQFPEAETLLHQLVAKYPNNPRTPNAQLLEAYCLGKRYQKKPTLIHRENYTNLLLKHVESYPSDRTAGDAYWMLGQHEEQRLQNPLALSYYRKIPANHRHGLAAQLGVARCYEKILAFLDQQETATEKDRKAAIQAKKKELENAAIKQKVALQAKTREWEQAAASHLGKIVEAYPKEPRPLHSGQAQVALRLAQLQLTRTESNYPRADSVLERILVSGTQRQAAQPSLSAEEKAEWSRILKSARQWRIVSLAGQGLSDRAETLVRELSNSNTQDVLSVLDGLMQVAKDSDSTTRRNLGQLQLQTALELHRRRDQLDPDEQKRLDHCRAQAYLATNKPQEALTIYNQMLSAQPKDSALQAEVANLLAETDDRQALSKAKQLWRTLEARSKPGSLPWLKRRYHVARCSWKLGQRDEARKLLGVTKLLYPELGNAELKLQYEQLQQELDNAR